MDEFRFTHKIHMASGEEYLVAWPSGDHTAVVAYKCDRRVEISGERSGPTKIDISNASYYVEEMEMAVIVRKTYIWTMASS